MPSPAVALGNPHSVAAAASARLWLGGAAGTALFLSVAFAWSQYALFADATRQAVHHRWPDGRPVAVDYVLFAGVAVAWRDGSIDRLYESDAHQHGLMSAALGGGPPFNDILNYNYPPFHAWLLWPARNLSYLDGFAYWTALHAAFAAAALWLLRGGLDPRTWAFAALLAWFGPPATNNLILGHQAFLHLLAFAAAWRCLDRGHDFAAGLAVSVLLYKPTLGIVIGPLLLLKGRWRAVAGVAAGGALLAAAAWAASPAACWGYRRMGGELLKLAAECPDFFAKHYNWLGAVSNFTRTVPAAFGILHWLAVAAPILAAAGLAAWAWRGRWEPGSDRFARGVSAALLATFFITPYLFSYDLASLAVAGFFTLRTLPRRPAWHAGVALACWSVTMVATAGNNTLLAAIDAATGLRLQPAPFALFAWLALEALGRTAPAAPVPGA